MFARSKFSITLLCASLLFAATVSALAQQPTAERVKGSATVSTSQLKGEVVQVEGRDLLVRLSTGEMRTFRVPETRRFLIDGKELTVRDLQPGTTLTATVKTTTTPITVRTKSVLSGRVWFASPPNVILTLPDGQNKQYVVKDKTVKFMIEGRPGTVFDLRKGMNVSAEKIVEEPDVEITTDTAVVGQAPALRAAAPKPAPEPPPPAPAPKPAPEPPKPAPAPAPAPKPAPEPPKPAPAAAPEPAPAAPPPAAPEPTPPPAPAPEPVAPEETGTSPLVWLGLIALLIVVAVIVVRKFRGKQVT
jgi:hypothetical protein